MNSNTVKRLSTYFAITVAISFMSQLEALKFDAAAIKSAGIWVLLAKSLLPGLVSLKAFFDNTAINNAENQQTSDEDTKP